MNAARGPFGDGAGNGRADEPSTTQQIQERYGVMAWYGRHTGGYWAMVDGAGLVEAPDPAGLGRQITAARGQIAASRFARPVPGTSAGWGGAQW